MLKESKELQNLKTGNLTFIMPYKINLFLSFEIKIEPLILTATKDLIYLIFTVVLRVELPLSGEFFGEIKINRRIVEWTFYAFL